MSRDNPPEPAVCGLNVAVLFDLSNSVEPYLSQYLAAGVGFVRALEDTPSHVALYTFASSAPANTTYNANVPLTSVQTALDAAPLITRIQGFRADLGQDGGTNWDRGIWQIAANPQHYDVAVVLTDGNPTFYTYTVTNPAGQFFTLDNVTVTDNKIHGPIHCAATTLAPGESTTCTAVYAIRQSDLDAGHVTNVATATGTATNGTPVLSDDVTTTVRAHQRPAISIVKTASVHSFDAAGLLITYFYRVTNTGNVSLLVTTGDDNAARPVCPRPVLPPGRSITCRSYHIVSEADVAAGHIPNVGFTTGQAPDGSEVHADDLLNIPEVHAPTISIVKIPSVFSFAAAGVPVTYFYLVTNSGNVTLDPVRVTDSRGLPVSCPRASLAPGELMTCTAHYVTTQTDVDRGSIPNTGTVTGTAPDGAEVTDHSSVAIPAVPAPAISIVKTASPVIFSAAGQVITYSYLVTNNGTVSLHGATVTDSRGLALSCPSTSLAVGQAMTCTARYRITQADLSAGPIINIALVQGTAPDGSVLVDGSLAFVFPTVFFFPVTG